MAPEVVVVGALLFGVALLLTTLRKPGTGAASSTSWPLLLAACLLVTLVVHNLLTGAVLWAIVDSLLLAGLIFYARTGRTRVR